MLKLNASRQTSSVTARGSPRVGMFPSAALRLRRNVSYSDHRIALQAAIVQWLETLFPLAPK